MTLCESENVVPTGRSFGSENLGVVPVANWGLVSIPALPGASTRKASPPDELLLDELLDELPVELPLPDELVLDELPPEPPLPDEPPPDELGDDPPLPPDEQLMRIKTPKNEPRIAPRRRPHSIFPFPLTFLSLFTRILRLSPDAAPLFFGLPRRYSLPMAIHDHGSWTHGHVYLGSGHGRAERRARLAMTVTALFMVVEIGCGFAYRSVALIADGVHMATHVGALGLAAGAYWLARRHAENARFTFGSGKFGDLAAFASAIILGLAGVGVAVESIEHLVSPAAVRFGDALLIAMIGLCVNLVSAFILRDDHGDDHGHAHEHEHDDHNMRAAYVHVLADAATSLLAILALGVGYLYGLTFLDPLVGIVGALVIASWAYGLVRDSAMVLLDADDDPKLSAEIRGFIEETCHARVADLHLWRLGPGHRGLIVSLVSPGETDAETIKTALRARYSGLSHVTVEIAVCADCGALPGKV